MPEELQPKEPQNPQMPAYLQRQSDLESVRDRVIRVMKPDIIGGGGYGRPSSGPDKPKKKLDWTKDIEIDLNKPLVEVKMDSDLWSSYLLTHPEEFTSQISTLNCLLGDSFGNIDIKLNLNKRDLRFIVEASFFRPEYLSDLIGSNECFKSIIYSSLQAFEKSQFKDLFHYDDTLRYFELEFNIDVDNKNSLRGQIEHLKKALSLLLEIILRTVKLTERKTINVPKPVIRESQPASGRSTAEQHEAKEKIKGLEVEDVKERLKDMGGNDDLKRQIERLVAQYKNAAFFEERGVSVPKGILLYGPPGTGKTLSAKIFAGEIGRKFYHVKSSDILNKYYGESEQSVKDIFQHVVGPCIIFIDEIDSIAETRENVSEPSRRVLAELLQQIDGLKSRKDIIVLAATNRKESLDPAILRAGRFDRHILVDAPDEKSREQIWNIHIKKQRSNSKIELFNQDLDISLLAKETDGLVGADIEEIVRRAKEKIVYEAFEAGKNDLLITTEMLMSETGLYLAERQKHKKDISDQFGFHGSAEELA